MARIIPVYLDDTYGIPAVVTGSTADTILDRLTSLSAKSRHHAHPVGRPVAWLGSAARAAPHERRRRATGAAPAR